MKKFLKKILDNLWRKYCLPDLIEEALEEIKPDLPFNEGFVQWGHGSFTNEVDAAMYEKKHYTLH